MHPNWGGLGTSASRHMPEASDESAPWTITLLSCVLVPWTLALLWRPRRSRLAGTAEWWLSRGFNEQSAAVRKARRLTSERPWLTISRAAYVGLIATTATLLTSTPPAPFDPFEALGLMSDANVTEIRSAYRQLAAANHPDKTSDPAAHGTFLRVAKAYSILTNARARRNYEIYGSPDGPQARAYGIALPPWLLDMESPLPVLGCLLVVILLPILALIRVRRSRAAATATAPPAEAYVRALLALPDKTPSDEVRQAGAFAPRQALRMESVSPAALPALLAKTLCATPLHLTPTQRAALTEWRKERRDGGDQGQDKGSAAAAGRSAGGSAGGSAAALSVAECEALVRAHISRSSLPPILHPALRELLARAAVSLEGFFGAACSVGTLRYDEGAAHVLSFSQRLTQALSLDESSLAQAPHLDADAAERMKRSAATLGAKGRPLTSPLPSEEGADKGSEEPKPKTVEGEPPAPKPASPKPASPKPASPKPASPKPASPKPQRAPPLEIAHLAALSTRARATALSPLELTQSQREELDAFCSHFPSASLSASHRKSLTHFPFFPIRPSWGPVFVGFVGLSLFSPGGVFFPRSFA